MAQNGLSVSRTWNGDVKMYIDLDVNLKPIKCYNAENEIYSIYSPMHD